MLIPSMMKEVVVLRASLSRRVNANSQRVFIDKTYPAQAYQEGWMLIPSEARDLISSGASLSRRVNANSQRLMMKSRKSSKLIKKGEC